MFHAIPALFLFVHSAAAAALDPASTTGTERTYYLRTSVTPATPAALRDGAGHVAWVDAYELRISTDCRAVDNDRLHSLLYCSIDKVVAEASPATADERHLDLVLDDLSLRLESACAWIDVDPSGRIQSFIVHQEDAGAPPLGRDTTALAEQIFASFDHVDRSSSGAGLAWAGMDEGVDLVHALVRGRDGLTRIKSRGGDEAARLVGVVTYRSTTGELLERSWSASTRDARGRIAIVSGFLRPVAADEELWDIAAADEASGARPLVAASLPGDQPRF